MPAKYLSTEKSVQKHLRRLPLHVHKKVIRALDVIKNNPLSGENCMVSLKVIISIGLVITELSIK